MIDRLIAAGVRAAPARFVSPFAYEYFLRAELEAARSNHDAAIESYLRK